MRSLYDALAELLATPEGLRTARLLQAAGLLGSPPATEPRPAPRPAGADQHLAATERRRQRDRLGPTRSPAPRRPSRGH